jgi:UDP-glucose 4-epimerase
MAILVTGGAGYIGSVTVEVLRGRGRDVVVLDDLTTGHAAAIPAGVPLVRGSVGDEDRVVRLCRDHAVTAVLHFAARSSVAESVAAPALYWSVNVSEAIRFFALLEEAGVRRFIFSSSASVYGGGQQGPLSEEAPVAPNNPYGYTKVAVERTLADFAFAYGWRAVSLRYFNAAGATEVHGEDHRPETHLIPLAIRAAWGQGPPLEIYGTDYATPDGTCVRDYIHVADLAEAHVQALEALDAGHRGGIFNLGNGRGFTVREVLHAVEAATGKPVPVREGSRRPGDPPMLVASAQRARVDLGWRPHRGDLEDIIASAAAWMQKHPEGYDGEAARKEDGS